jgi:hypothetical protein
MTGGLNVNVLFHPVEEGVVCYPTNIHLPQDFGLVHYIARK